MRRNDKEIADRRTIDAIIRGSDVCRLGLALDNLPYLVPMSFGYDGQAIYLHSAGEGKKVDHFQGNDNVCFEFERGVKVQRHPGDACRWTVSFQSVIGYGTIQEVTQAAQREYGLRQIVSRYGGQVGQLGETAVAKTRVWKIVIHSLTGKGSGDSHPGRLKAPPKVEPQHHALKDGRVLLVREAEAEDARALLDYVQAVSAESDFLSFGSGEFELGEAEEAEFLRACRASDNQVYLVASIEEEIVGALTFSGGRRRRTRHAGEFGLSVRGEHWGLGIGGIMLDTLLAWARDSGIVTKINLRVRADNARAIRLYESRRFVKEGTIRKAFFVEGRYYDHLCMGLEL